MSIAAVHVHENHVHVVHMTGAFVNVGYDGVAQSVGMVETTNHDNVISEIVRADGEILESLGDRARDAIGVFGFADEACTAEEIVRTQSWIVAKRKARFGIG